MVKGAKKSNIGYVYGVMEELQRLREDVDALREKNRDLAKQLNVTKMELARERKQQQAILTEQVRSWAKKKFFPAPTKSTIGVQCDFSSTDMIEEEEFAETSSSPRSDMQKTPPRRRSCSPSDPRRSLSPTIKIVRREVLIVGTNRQESQRECVQSTDDDSRMQSPSPPRGDITQPTRSTDDVEDITRSLASQFESKRELRHRNRDVSYVEPPLNTKIRRGDYYGLLKRSHLMGPRARSLSNQQMRSSQRSPRRVPASPPRKLTMISRRPRATVSYVLPKLNTKLRQGDKFTFTT